MFTGCTSLTIVILKYTGTLSTNEYKNMFYGCTSLDYVEAYFTGSNFGDGYTTGWFTNVPNSSSVDSSSHQRYYKNGSATYTIPGYSTRSVDTLPSEWSVNTILNT